MERTARAGSSQMRWWVGGRKQATAILHTCSGLERAEQSKRKSPIPSILCYPPYKGFFDVKVEEDGGSSEAYRTPEWARPAWGLLDSSQSALRHQTS